MIEEKIPVGNGWKEIPVRKLPLPATVLTISRWSKDQLIMTSTLGATREGLEWQISISGVNGYTPTIWDINHVLEATSMCKSFEVDLNTKSKQFVMLCT